MYTIVFSAQAQAAANGVHSVKLPRGATLVGVSLGVEALTGTPTNIKVDVNDDGTEIVADAVTLTAAGAGYWLTTHFGGTNAPVAIAAGSVVTVDVKFTGGTTPTADYDVTLFLLAGEV